MIWNSRHGFRSGKYNAKKTPCQSDHVHHSKAEAVYCDNLRISKLAGDIYSFETQFPVDLVVNGAKICTHTIDFKVETRGGSYFAEVKGKQTPDWILKLKLFNALYPDSKYVVVVNGVEYDSREYRKGKSRRKSIGQAEQARS